MLTERYWGSFVLLAGLCFVLQMYARATGTKTREAAEKNAAFASFQSNYLFVFLLAMLADWLQGPYVYELYVSYGFDQQAIAELFVMGFGSSMIFGTFIGSLADKYGRKKLCVCYAVLYIAGCLSKTINDYWVLMVGRFLCGIATSLLFSVFESWMVCEHFKKGFSGDMLSQTFSYATFGNGLVAVSAGLTANAAASNYGYIAPFLLACLPLVIIIFIVGGSWSENYGDQKSGSSSSLMRGFDLVRSDPRIFALGLGQSCFEGAMYTFVFMWTPALKSAEEIQAEQDGKVAEESTAEFLGVIFAAFMVSVMVGSSIFNIFAKSKDSIFTIPLYLHAVAFAAMACITVFMDNKFIVYSMFLVFEISVGVFYPAYGMIKSEKIPEDIRSAVMNIFRIPLNLFVVVLLLKIKFLSPTAVFQLCTAAHLVSLLCYSYFYSTMVKTEPAYREEIV